MPPLARFAPGLAKLLEYKLEDAPADIKEKWEAKVAGAIKRASDAQEVAVHAQIREKLAGMKDMKDRMLFLERHGADPTLANAACQPLLSSQA